jgi:L-lactate dehydrogenase
MEYTLTDDEKIEFKRCCDAIRGNIAKAEQFWKK